MPSESTLIVNRPPIGSTIFSLPVEMGPKGLASLHTDFLPIATEMISHLHGPSCGVAQVMIRVEVNIMVYRKPDHLSEDDTDESGPSVSAPGPTWDNPITPSSR